MDIYQCLDYWCGLEELGFLRDKTKTINYNNKSTEALQCFNSTTALTCEQPTCRWVSTGQCLPAEHESKWWVKDQSVINSRSTGVLYTLVDAIEVDIREDIQVRISILRPTVLVSHIVVIFPSGYPYRVPGRDINRIVSLIIKQTQDFPSASIILCGHSMGAAWAQEIALELPEVDLQRIHVVGSGAFIWAYEKEVQRFVRQFKGRFFFMAATAVNTSQIQIIDSTVFEVFEESWCGSKDNNERAQSRELCSFPTHVFDVLHHRMFNSEVMHRIRKHGFVAGMNRYSFQNSLYLWSDYPVKFGGWGKSAILNTKIHEWVFYRKSLRQWLLNGHVMDPLKPGFLDRESQDAKCNQKHSSLVQSIRKKAHHIKVNEGLQIKSRCAEMSWFLTVPFDRLSVHQYFLNETDTLKSNRIRRALETDVYYAANQNQHLPLSSLIPDMDESSFYLLQQKIENPFWLFTPHPTASEYQKEKEFHSLSDFLEYLVVKMENREFSVYSMESAELVYQYSSKKRPMTNEN